ncbi:MAG TPA: PEP-CTERM sorting domain-containing protein [Accumulibacter sp.]|uniref:PEP-CTERM sorting domain-containing protein n=1 Tax=Accumulibacter sp. TaxID=2053492 RepID=UPI002CE84EEA|nr:PEP-CTERM sorting domain-containing protein [Accumulibacter sp.]HRD91055.1 PEP-CTERM sorting domain-containing protein [Accumulibacter sp.]
MKILPLAKALAAATLATALATPALANNVNITNFTYLPASSVSVATPSYSGRAGQFSGFLDSKAFVTFCTELTEQFSFNPLPAAPYVYSIVSGVSAWGATKSNALDKVLSYAKAQNWPNSADTSAAVQAAVWEVLYETTGSYSFGAGTFTASSSGATQTALNNFNWATVGTTSVSVHADQLSNKSEKLQDFLVTTPVPEPESYAMMLAGLSLVGAIARRRRSSAN